MILIFLQSISAPTIVLVILDILIATTSQTIVVLPRVSSEYLITFNDWMSISLPVRDEID